MPTIPGSVSSFVVRPALSPLAVPATDLRQQSSKSSAVETQTVTAKASGDIIIDKPTKSTAGADAVQAAVPFNEQHAGTVEHVEHSKPGFVSPTKIYSSLSNQITGHVEVTARSEYSSHMSRAADNYGVWTYNIAITNHGDKPIRLLHRMFVECCAVLDHSQAVRRSDCGSAACSFAAAVASPNSTASALCDTPIIYPGETFRYNSFAPLHMDVGALRLIGRMSGSYTFEVLDNSTSTANDNSAIRYSNSDTFSSSSKQIEVKVAPFHFILPAADHQQILLQKKFASLASSSTIVLSVPAAAQQHVQNSSTTTTTTTQQQQQQQLQQSEQQHVLQHSTNSIKQPMTVHHRQ
eukprot:19366-Heterococcus_DN1.PRE.3